MKKIIFAIALLFATTWVRGQVPDPDSTHVAGGSGTSPLIHRVMAGMGGGITFPGRNHKAMANTIGGAGIASFGYTLTYDLTAISFGMKTGLDISYMQPQLKMTTRTDNFINTDYQGKDWAYSVTAKNVKYKQNTVNFDIPVMLAAQSDHFYAYIGAKFLFPLWANYTQTMESSQITAYQLDNPDKTYVNDPTTGTVAADQYSIGGRQNQPVVYVCFSMEYGYVWDIRNGHKLGLELYINPVDIGLGGKTVNDRSIIEVGSITQAGKQPEVAVNNLINCYNYRTSSFQMGLKLVYCFDMRRQGKNKDTEEKIILLTK